MAISPKEQRFPILMVDVEGEKIGTATWILCWILCWGLAAWETVKAHVRRTAAPLPLLLGTNTTPLQEHKSQCNVFTLGTFTKKGPATLNGLVKLQASRVPGAPGGLA